MKWAILTVLLVAGESYAIPWKQSKDLTCLSEAIYFESKGESTIGQYLVAQVILNRLDTTAKRSSICAVVYEKSFDKSKPYACQFSFTCSTKKIKINKKSKEWEKALRIANIALYDKYSDRWLYDLSEGSMFYTRCDIKTSWMKNMKLVVREGNHCFLKEDIKYVR